MTYQESVEYLFSLGNEVSAMKLGLDNIRTLLHSLGDPQSNYLKVQVAGTNGKGSVCAFLDSICRAADIRVGVFTSPHLVRINERIRIAGQDIADDEFAEYATKIRETAERLIGSGDLEHSPTFFEQITAAALVAFAAHGVKLAILETGLGGRLDAVTAADAEIAAITRIDLDHQEYLGDTIDQIAAEKAAIIHPSSRVIVGRQTPQVLEVILDRCRDVGAVPTIVDAAADLAYLVSPPEALGLAGAHQVENAEIAVLLAKELSKEFSITPEDISTGLAAAVHPGRLERHGRFLLDGAHNIGGARSLAAYLDEKVNGPITLVFTSMRGKNAREVLSMLAPRAVSIVLTQVSNERSMHYEELLAALPDDLPRTRVFATDRAQNALAVAEHVTPTDGTILITGSLYLVGEVKPLLSSEI